MALFKRPTKYLIYKKIKISVDPLDRNNIQNTTKINKIRKYCKRNYKSVDIILLL